MKIEKINLNTGDTKVINDKQFYQELFGISSYNNYIYDKMKNKKIITTERAILVATSLKCKENELQQGNLEDITGFISMALGYNRKEKYAIIPKGAKYYSNEDIYVSDQIIVLHDKSEISTYNPVLSLSSAISSRGFILRQTSDLEYLNKKIKYNGAYINFGQEITGRFVIEPNLEGLEKLSKKEKFVKVLGTIVLDGNDLVTDKLIICA